MYAQHVSKYWRSFGRKRVLVERSEDFYADAWPTVQRVLSFASLSTPVEFAVGLVSRSRRGLTATERNSGGVWGGKEYVGALQPPERRKLQAFYAPHNMELYAMLGRNMGWERNDSDAVATLAQQQQQQQQQQEQATPTAKMIEESTFRPEL